MVLAVSTLGPSSCSHVRFLSTTLSGDLNTGRRWRTISSEPVDGAGQESGGANSRTVDWGDDGDDDGVSAMTSVTEANLPARDNAGSPTGFGPGPAAASNATGLVGRRADLAVDTALLRRAAELLDDAVAAFRGGGSCEVFRCPLSDTSLGDSAAGREVVAAAARRVAGAVDGAGALALRVATAAEKLRATAQHFDLAEADAIPGPR